MNYTLRRADRVTHLKIVVVALVAVVAVIAVGLNARKNDLVAQGPTNGAVSRPGSSPRPTQAKRVRPLAEERVPCLSLIAVVASLARPFR